MSFQLKTRDFINVGIFGVLYFVAIFASGMLGFFGPWAMFLGWAVGIILGGFVLVLFMARTPKMYGLALVGLMVGLAMVATGHYWATLIACPLLGLLADMVVTGMGKATALKPGRAIWGYAIFTMWLPVPMLPMILNRSEYLKYVADTMSADYAQSFDNLFQPWVLGVWTLCVLVLGLFAGWLGTLAHAKHFKRAGLAK